MEEFIKGDVVIIFFPFSDFTKSKRRPALVISKSEFDDYLLCQITSKKFESDFILPLTSKDFMEGELPLDSYIRVSKLFTVSNELVKQKAGHLKKELMDKVISRTIDFIKK